MSESVQMAALAEGEGCLSVDREISGYVPRHARLKLRWYDLDGNESTLNAYETMLRS